MRGDGVAGGKAVGDFNGDGKPDLAVVGQGSEVSILLGNGDGTFQSALTGATTSAANLPISWQSETY
jgi:hypothetical protein